MEEFGVISNTRLINTCANIVKNKFSYAYPHQYFPYRPNHILECEFYLLENMDCCLVNCCRSEMCNLTNFSSKIVFISTYKVETRSYFFVWSSCMVVEIKKTFFNHIYIFIVFQVVFQPYRSLVQYCQDMQVPVEFC